MECSVNILPHQLIDWKKKVNLAHEQDLESMQQVAIPFHYRNERQAIARIGILWANSIHHHKDSTRLY